MKILKKSEKKTKEFVKKKKKKTNLSRNKLASVSQRAQLFDSIHGMCQLQNWLRAG